MLMIKHILACFVISNESTNSIRSDQIRSDQIGASQPVSQFVVFICNKYLFLTASRDCSLCIFVHHYF
jgi:hypothetical protein